MKKKRNNYQKPKNPNRINEEIRVTKVKIVGDYVKESGIYFIDKALEMADELNLDLVEVARNQDKISICKFMDYQKFLYNKKKNEKKSDKVETKELRFRPNIDSNDYEFKKRYAENFLKKGKRVKAYVMFKGREMKFKDKGQKLLLKLAVELSEVGTAENVPKMEGYRMNIFLKPKKNK